MRETEMSLIRDRKDVERKMFKIRRNVFPPILTNRGPQNSTQRSSKHKESTRKVRFQVSEPSSSYSQSSGNISSSSNEDKEEELCQQNEVLSSTTNNCIIINSTNNEEKQAEESSNSNNNFYFKYSSVINYEKEEEKENDEMSDLSSCSSNSSNFVENEWSELEGNSNNNNQRSRETQEAEIKEQFKEAFSHLSKGEYEKTASICILILSHPIMQNFYIKNWEGFNWSKKEEDKNKENSIIIHSDMAKIYFNINLAMIGICQNPLPFYIQSLSIHPELKDLWFLAGITAFKQSDWHSARFCFGHCEDEIRTLEALLLVHFCEQNFLECSFTLNKIFKIYPKHELGLFIYSFILNNFPFWKQFYNQIFKEEIETIKLDNYKFHQFLNKIEQIIIKKSNKFFQFNLFSSALILNEDLLLPKYSPLKIKLKNDMRMEDIGICLCNVFDRIEHFSSFAEQKIVFYMDTNNTEKKTQTQTTLKENSTPTINKNNNLKIINDRNKNCNKFQEKDSNCINLQKSLIEQINGKIINSENNKNNRTTFSSSDIEIIEEEEDIIKTNKTHSQDEYYFNKFNNNTPKLLNNNIRRPLSWAEKTKLRQKYKQRSQRNNREEYENDSSLRRSQRVQNSPKYFNIAESWAWNFTKLMRLANNSLNNRSLDHLINYRWIEELTSFNPLIEKFVNASKNENWKLSEYLFKFLQFVCEKKNVGLTLGQAEVFRQVYIRWSSTFLNLTTKNVSIETDLYIHQMAAELGSHRALSILQLYFDGEFILNFKQNESQKINNSAEENDFSFIKNTELEKSQFDLFKWIFGRIDAEQQKEKVELMDNNSMECDSDETPKNNFDSEQNERLRDLKIRYRWLTANLQPNELGLLLQQQSSESIHFVLIYCQIKMAINEILNAENNKDIKIFTNANFGINCLSKRNLEEFLKKKVAEYES